MKKHIKKIMGMGLACMLFLGVPFQASAAEVTGTLSTETSGEDGAADGADNSSDAAANPDSGAGKRQTISGIGRRLIRRPEEHCFKPDGN